MLDPKPGDLTIIRIIIVRTAYRCIDTRRIMVSIVKDKTDQDSWFSAKPIIVGNLINILVGTELNLRQDVYIHIFIYEIHFIFVYIGGL